MTTVMIWILFILSFQPLQVCILVDGVYIGNTLPVFQNKILYCILVLILILVFPSPLSYLHQF